MGLLFSKYNYSDFLGKHVTDGNWYRAQGLDLSQVAGFPSLSLCPQIRPMMSQL